MVQHVAVKSFDLIISEQAMYYVYVPAFNS